MSFTIKNSYCIKLKKTNNYVHPEKIKGKIEYVLKEGVIGAAIWDKKRAKLFIDSIEQNKSLYEMVLIEDAAPTEQNTIKSLVLYIENLQKTVDSKYYGDFLEGYKAALVLIKLQAECISKGIGIIDIDKIEKSNDNPDIN